MHDARAHALPQKLYDTLRFEIRGDARDPLAPTDEQLAVAAAAWRNIGESVPCEDTQTRETEQ